MPLRNLFVLLLLILASYLYLRFAHLDHRYPKKSGNRLVACVMSFVIALLCFASVGMLKECPEDASTIAMIALGMLAAPAIAPPLYVSPEEIPSRLGRFVHKIKSILSGSVVQKVIAVIIAVSAYVIPGEWYLITAVACSLLLFAKGSASAMTECGGVDEVITPSAMRYWGGRTLLACVCFGLVWAAGPYLALSQTEFAPPSWAAFAGFGIGSLFMAFDG